MTPEELSRELSDLDRLGPPALDPAALLRLETQLADLEGENTELRQKVQERDARIHRLTAELESRKRELLDLESLHEREQKEQDNRAAEWRRREAFWATSAQRERADRRAKGVEKTRWMSLGLAGLMLGLGFLWAGERYWTFTHDEHLLMLEAAAKDKAAAVVLVQQARQEYEKAARLNRRARRSADSANRTPEAGGNSPPGENNDRSAAGQVWK